MDVLGQGSAVFSTGTRGMAGQSLTNAAHSGSGANGLLPDGGSDSVTSSSDGVDTMGASIYARLQALEKKLAAMSPDASSSRPRKSLPSSESLSSRAPEGSIEGEGSSPGKTAFRISPSIDLSAGSSPEVLRAQLRAEAKRQREEAPSPPSEPSGPPSPPGEEASDVSPPLTPPERPPRGKTPPRPPPLPPSRAAPPQSLPPDQMMQALVKLLQAAESQGFDVKSVAATVAPDVLSALSSVEASPQRQALPAASENTQNDAADAQGEASEDEDVAAQGEPLLQPTEHGGKSLTAFRSNDVVLGPPPPKSAMRTARSSPSLSPPSEKPFPRRPPPPAPLERTPGPIRARSWSSSANESPSSKSPTPRAAARVPKPIPQGVPVRSPGSVSSRASQGSPSGRALVRKRSRLSMSPHETGLQGGDLNNFANVWAGGLRDEREFEPRVPQRGLFETPVEEENDLAGSDEDARKEYGSAPLGAQIEAKRDAAATAIQSLFRARVAQAEAQQLEQAIARIRGAVHSWAMSARDRFRLAATRIQSRARVLLAQKKLVQAREARARAEANEALASSVAATVRRIEEEVGAQAVLQGLARVGAVKDGKLRVRLRVVEGMPHIIHDREHPDTHELLTQPLSDFLREVAGVSLSQRRALLARDTEVEAKEADKKWASPPASADSSEAQATAGSDPPEGGTLRRTASGRTLVDFASIPSPGAGVSPPANASSSVTTMDAHESDLRMAWEAATQALARSSGPGLPLSPPAWRERKEYSSLDEAAKDVAKLVQQDPRMRLEATREGPSDEAEAVIDDAVEEDKKDPSLTEVERHVVRREQPHSPGRFPRPTKPAGRNRASRDESRTVAPSGIPSLSRQRRSQSVASREGMPGRTGRPTYDGASGTTMTPGRPVGRRSFTQRDNGPRLRASSTSKRPENAKKRGGADKRLREAVLPSSTDARRKAAQRAAAHVREQARVGARRPTAASRLRPVSQGASAHDIARARLLGQVTPSVPHKRQAPTAAEEATHDHVPEADAAMKPASSWMAALLNDPPASPSNSPMTRDELSEPTEPPRDWSPKHASAMGSSSGREEHVRETADRILQSLMSRHVAYASEQSDLTRLNAAIAYSSAMGDEELSTSTRATQLAALELILHGYRGDTRDRDRVQSLFSNSSLDHVVSPEALAKAIGALQDDEEAPADPPPPVEGRWPPAPSSAPMLAPAGPFAGLLPVGGLSSKAKQ
jgi:hypothetical protein